MSLFLYVYLFLALGIIISFLVADFSVYKNLFTIFSGIFPSWIPLVKSLGTLSRDLPARESPRSAPDPFSLSDSSSPSPFPPPLLLSPPPWPLYLPIPPPLPSFPLLNRRLVIETASDSDGIVRKVSSRNGEIGRNAESARGDWRFLDSMLSPRSNVEGKPAAEVIRRLRERGDFLLVWNSWRGNGYVTGQLMPWNARV